MFNRRTQALVAIALAAGLITGVPASGAQTGAATAVARLETRTAIFAATADLAASRSSGGLAEATAQPPVASGSAAAGTAAAQDTPQTPAAEHDPAKVAIGAEIYTNLKMVEIGVAGAKIGMSGNAEIQAMSDADRQRLFGLVEEEIRKRGDIMCERVAEANVDRFTMEQLKIIRDLSRIKFVQDAVLHGAGLVPQPDPASMTPAEQTLVNTYGNAAFVSDFMTNSDLTPLSAELQIAMRNALARYSGQPVPTV